MTTRPIGPRPIDESQTAAANPSVEQAPGYPKQEAADEDARTTPESADIESTRWPEPGSIHAPFSNGHRTDAVGMDDPVPKKPTPPEGAGTKQDER